MIHIDFEKNYSYTFSMVSIRFIICSPPVEVGIDLVSWDLNDEELLRYYTCIYTITSNGKYATECFILIR